MSSERGSYYGDGLKYWTFSQIYPKGWVGPTGVSGQDLDLGEWARAQLSVPQDRFFLERNGTTLMKVQETRGQTNLGFMLAALREQHSETKPKTPIRSRALVLKGWVGVDADRV